MRGNVFDSFMAIFLVSLFFIGVIVSYFIYDSFKTNAPDLFTTEYQGYMENTFPVFDWGLLFIFFGLGFASVISAFFIDTHPVFFVMSIFLFIIVMIIGGIYANSFWSLLSSGNQLSSYSENFPLSLTFFQNAPTFMLVVGVLIVIALYSKSGGE